MKSIAQFFRWFLLSLRRLWFWLRRKPGIAFGQGQFRTLVYVVNRQDNTVSVIDRSAAKPVFATIPVGKSPRWVAITPDGSFAFVTNFDSWDLSIIDTSSNTEISRFGLSFKPFGIAITPDGSKAYITLPDDDKVASVLILGNGMANLAGYIDVGTQPGWVAITPDGSVAYVTNFKSDDVSVIDTATDKVTATVNLVPALGPGPHPCGVAITPDGVHAYVACTGAGNTVQIEVKNLNKVNAKLWFDTPLGQCFGVAIATVTPTLFHVYITDGGGGDVDVLADQDFTFVGYSGGGLLNPSGVAVTPDGAYAYVTCAWGDNVAVIDTKNIQVVEFIQVGKQPFGIAIKA
jgi:YVTN family beta-propeller protein